MVMMMNSYEFQKSYKRFLMMNSLQNNVLGKWLAPLALLQYSSKKYKHTFVSNMYLARLCVSRESAYLIL